MARCPCKLPSSGWRRNDGACSADATANRVLPNNKNGGLAFLLTLACGLWIQATIRVHAKARSRVGCRMKQSRGRKTEKREVSGKAGQILPPMSLSLWPRGIGDRSPLVHFEPPLLRVKPACNFIITRRYIFDPILFPVLSGFPCGYDWLTRSSEVLMVESGSSDSAFA